MCSCVIAGAAYGTVEGCFLKQVPNSNVPMFIRSLRVIAGRSVLIGEPVVQGGMWEMCVCVCKGVCVWVGVGLALVMVPSFWTD